MQNTHRPTLSETVGSFPLTSFLPVSGHACFSQTRVVRQTHHRHLQIHAEGGWWAPDWVFRFTKLWFSFFEQLSAFGSWPCISAAGPCLNMLVQENQKLLHLGELPVWDFPPPLLVTWTGASGPCALLCVPQPAAVTPCPALPRPMVTWSDCVLNVPASTLMWHRLCPFWLQCGKLPSARCPPPASSLHSWGKTKQQNKPFSTAPHPPFPLPASRKEHCSNTSLNHCSQNLKKWKNVDYSWLFFPREWASKINTPHRK